MAFPGAFDDLDHPNYTVVGAPLDVSTSFRPGARFGPERIRTFARHFDDYDHRTEQHFTDLGVTDHGDIRAWDDAPGYLESVEGVLRDVVDAESIPLMLGGEHTVSVAGVAAVEPDVFVSIDAHLDLREELAGNEWSHATVTRRALDVADEAVVVGARTGSEAEWDRADRDDVTVISPEDVPDWSPSIDGSIYLSVDIDAADPGVAPGTGTPEPFGLAATAIRDVVRTLAPHSIGFDVVEVNDRDDGQAASLGAKLLREFVFTHSAGF
jgi:agmatinase